MFNTPGTRAGRGRLVSSTTVASFTGDNSGNYTTSSAAFAALGNFTASISANVGDIIEIELTGTVLGATAATVQYTDFGFFINGVDMAKYAEVSTVGNTVSNPEATVAFRATRTIVAGDLSSGLFTVVPKWKVSTGTVAWINSSGFDGLLTLTKLVAGSAVAASSGAAATFSVWDPFNMGTNICSAGATGDGCSQLCVGSNGSFSESCRGTKSIVVGAADIMFEIKVVGAPSAGVAGPTAWGLGVATSAATLLNYPGRDAFSWAYYNSGVSENNNVAPAYGATYSNGDIIGVRVNVAGNLIFYKNGVSQGTAYTIAASTVLFPFAGSGSTAGDRGFVLNTGGKAFTNPVGGVSAWG